MLPSLNVPLAVKACVVPAAMLGFVGLIVKSLRVAEVTVSKADPLMTPTVATTLVCPGVMPDAIPLAAMVATEDEVTLHDTDVVMFR